MFLRVSWVGLAAAWLTCGVQLFFQCREIRVEQGSYPVSAIHYIAGQKLGGKLLCTFNWAQYALAALGPHQRGEKGLLVHVDGRCRTSYSQQMLDEHFDFVIGNVGPEMRYRGPENKFNAGRALEHGNPDLALISRLQTPSVEVMHGQGSAWVLLYQDELAQVWGRASRYAQPASPDFIPPSRRQIGDAKQGGFAAWPAIPSRHQFETPHQPEAQTKEIAAASDIIIP
jgi:4-amino-4-deoxy-L-arabinose transferase-like glycosyltransferase